MVDYKVGITEKSAKTLKEQLQNTLPSKTIDLLDLLSSEAFLAAPPKAKGSRVTLAKLVGRLMFMKLFELIDVD